MSATQTTEAGPLEGTARHAGGRRRRWAIGLVAAAGAGIAIVVAVAVAVAVPFGSSDEGTSVDSTAATGLAQVRRGTLSARTLENGTLGYAGDYQLVNQASGTVTELPGVGQVIRAGQILYRVDGEPVVLLRGSATVYRSLSSGTEGADVRQLNAALVSLGYADADDLDPDSDTFGYQTERALEKLQDHLDLDQTGELALGQAVFVPSAAVRITKAMTLRGASLAAGAVVLQASSTRRQVTVALDASQQSQVAVGDRVTVSLPDGGSTPGVVSAVGKVAKKVGDNTTIDVRIRLRRPQATGRLDQAPVQVSIVTDTAKHVLSVPVTALLALAGGGYAVEVVQASGAHRLIAVKPGLFDDSAGTVEVTGEGLASGQDVVVPAS